MQRHCRDPASVGGTELWRAVDEAANPTYYPIGRTECPIFGKVRSVPPPTPNISDIDLTDARAFASGVPHQWFTRLREQSPVWWHEATDGPGFWAVTGYAECNAVNRDYRHFSSSNRGTYLWELPEEELHQQQLLMLNMDPPLHTRYRRLVNKGFTPRIVNQLGERIHLAADRIIDDVIESGRTDFVTEVAAELPLVVIAELLGVPHGDRHKMFAWSNQMVGHQDPEFGQGLDSAESAALELYAYASELFAEKRADPQADLMSVLTGVELDGERLSELELELFFLLLTVAGNETTRNLISGAMAAFFDHPDQWARLRADRSLMPSAVEEMLRFVTPVMNFRRQSTAEIELGGQRIEADQKVVFFHISANRDASVFEDPHRFDVGRTPNPHMTFGGGGPHFCLGANLARVEIQVIFDHLLDRIPDIQLDGEVEHLQSTFINGIKHMPVSFQPGPPVNR
jgi:cholest-4-en-3-one 26-monooxygenase